jgi:hypothetical protein
MGIELTKYKTVVREMIVASIIEMHCLEQVLEVKK